MSHNGVPIEDIEMALKKIKKEDPIVLFCGKEFTKMFLKELLKEQYSWRNILNIYRTGIIKTNFRGAYEITT